MTSRIGQAITILTGCGKRLGCWTSLPATLGIALMNCRAIEPSSSLPTVRGLEKVAIRFLQHGRVMSD